jgi:hypothetical protein
VDAKDEVLKRIATWPSGTNGDEWQARQFQKWAQMALDGTFETYINSDGMRFVKRCSDNHIHDKG